jgi:recombinational DNA repair ATPase RecF
MKIQKIKIINILGLDEIEINPGEGTNIITAHNGAGKTSILEAIKLALGSGSDATVLRKGADKGQVVLMLDEDTVIKADVNSSGKVTRSITKDGIKSTQPISDIKEIADAIGINPVEFIANPKARLDIIVKCLGYEADTAAIKDVFGIDVPQGGIEVLDQVRKSNL